MALLILPIRRLKVAAINNRFDAELLSVWSDLPKFTGVGVPEVLWKEVDSGG